MLGNTMFKLHSIFPNTHHETNTEIEFYRA